MINIVCFKWGTLFSAEYVNKLYNAVERNVTVPHTFTCFTENPEGVECNTQPFLNALPTWWYIIGLFNRDHGFEGKVLYMDLDTVITGNIDHIISLDTDFAITEDFYRPKGLQTTFIMWKPEWGYYLWDKYLQVAPSNPGPHFMRGTNGFIETYTKDKDVDIFQDEFPSEFISYKVHIKDKHKRMRDLPGNIDTAKIICYHGKPRPHEMRNLVWMKEHWI
jgi:hypothetical protein